MGRARPCWTQALEFSSLVGSCLEVNVVLALGPRFLHFGVLAAVIPCETLQVLAAMKICWDKEEARFPGGACRRKSGTKRCLSKAILGHNRNTKKHTFCEYTCPCAASFPLFPPKSVYFASRPSFALLCRACRRLRCAVRGEKRSERLQAHTKRNGSALIETSKA